MRVEYLRHEYTWSSQCITGTKVGWGITGSSTPLDKDKLIELEKLAAGTVSDPADRVPIESLVYSPECGFTKMVTLPYHDGEDGRKSKVVHIYQVSEQINMVPEAYLLPGEQWDEERIGDYFAPMATDTLDENVDDILNDMHVLDRLPAFLRVVFEALFGDSENVNFVVKWSEHEFAKKSRKLLYAIHKLIPEVLRKKASYQSFSRGEVSNVTFYFSREAIGKNYIVIDDKMEDPADQSDELENFFYHRLAESYVKKDSLYPEMMDKMSTYYTDHSTESHNLKKLQWIMTSLCIKAGENPISIDYIMREIPQLFYWCEEDELLSASVENVLAKLHESAIDANQYMIYQKSLIEGYTKRSENLIGREIVWSMKHLFNQRPDLFEKQLKNIQRKNISIYTMLLSVDISDDDSYAANVFNRNSESFEQLRNYLMGMNLDSISSEFKDRCLVKGIDLLNEDLFRIENYQAFDDLVKKLDRPTQAATILKNFVMQLQELRTELDDDRLEAGAFVEGLLNDYEKTDKYSLLTNEMAARKIKSSPTINLGRMMGVSSKDSDVTDDIEFENETDSENAAVNSAMNSQQDAAGQFAAMRNKKTQEIMAQAEKLDKSFLGFLLYTFPMGFLSGCAFYMFHYSMKIGHGKIALGMSGMWAIVLLNYLAYLQLKQRTIRTWQTTGIFIIEGLMVTFFACLFERVHLHLIFFIVLGVISIILSISHLFGEREERLRRKER